MTYIFKSWRPRLPGIVLGQFLGVSDSKTSLNASTEKYIDYIAKMTIHGDSSI